MTKELSKQKEVKAGGSLSKFVKQMCDCWTGRPSEECLGLDVYGKSFRNPGKCRIMEGKSCKYFKEAVLHQEDYKFPRLCFVEDPAFEQRVRKQYKKIDHTVVEAEARRCPGCGAALKPRQRYCTKCAKRRARDASRQRQQKYRFQNVST